MYRGKKMRTVIGAALLCLSLLAGCGGTAGESSHPAAAQEKSTAEETTAEESGAEETAAAVSEPSETEAETAETEGILTAESREDIQAELRAAMEAIRQPRIMDVSAVNLEQPEIEIRNLYYEITAERPELKYAYDLTVERQENELICRFSYMPYKTGDYPEGFDGEEISSLKELVEAAQKHLTEETAAVRIMDPSLDPDTMNRALQQVGGGYLYCALNRDGTEIRYEVPVGLTREACLSALEQADQLADQIAAQIVQEDMSEKEKAKALYAYVTTHVTYDQRYYSDRTSMPYESQTALGALRDGAAICGGYAQALRLLFEKAGIPCWNVSGKCLNEYHMWNIAKVDGEWVWFDATTDRGSTGEYGFLRFALKELDPMKYKWEEDWVRPLLD